MRLSEWIYQPRHVNPRIQVISDDISYEDVKAFIQDFTKELF